MIKPTVKEFLTVAATRGINIPDHCAECESKSMEWVTTTRFGGGVADGRGRGSDAETIFVLGCSECSETLRVVTADEICDLMNDLFQSRA